MTPEGKKNTKGNILDPALIQKKNIKNITKTIATKDNDKSDKEVAATKKKEEIEVAAKTDKRKLAEAKKNSKRKGLIEQTKNAKIIILTKGDVNPETSIKKILTSSRDVKLKESVETILKKLKRCKKNSKNKSFLMPNKGNTS